MFAVHHFFQKKKKIDLKSNKKMNFLNLEAILFFLFFNSFGDLNFIFAVLIVSFILPLVRR